PNVAAEHPVSPRVVPNAVHRLPQRLHELIPDPGLLHLIISVGVRDIVLRLWKVHGGHGHCDFLTRCNTCSHERTFVGSASWAASRRSNSAIKSSVGFGCQPSSTS